MFTLYLVNPAIVEAEAFVAPSPTTFPVTPTSTTTPPDSPKAGGMALPLQIVGLLVVVLPNVQCARSATGWMGHRASDCYQQYDGAEPKDSIVQADFSTPSNTPNSTCYPNWSATHHLTSNFSNLNFRSEDYNVPDKVHMCNGTGLSIDHIGDSLFSSPTLSFLLHNVLHVLSITKNIRSVHKFTLKTKTYIEFYP